MPQTVLGDGKFRGLEVLHRQFPAVREMPESEGLLRCPK